MHNLIANDSYESITDYHQASGHVKTLEKIQELGVAMVRQDLKNVLRDSTPVSALDSAFDYTDKATTPPPDRLGQSRRWKYANSRVRQMTGGEFQVFVNEQVKNKAGAFMKILQARAHRQKLVQQKMIAEEELQTSETVTADQTAIQAKIRFATWIEKMPAVLLNDYLRQGKKTFFAPYSGQMVKTSLTYRAALNRTIADNIDLGKPWAVDVEPDKRLFKPILPGLEPSQELWKSWRESSWAAEQAFWQSFQDTQGDDSYFANYMQVLRNDITLDSRLFNYVREFLDIPGIATMANRNSQTSGEANAFHLSTHPTAGISYLRTNNVIMNHAILGPQRNKAPLTARLLKESSSHLSFGIAGIVAQKVAGHSVAEYKRYGGTKLDKRVIKKLYVDGEGTIQMETDVELNKDALRIRDGYFAPPVVDTSEAQRYGSDGRKSLDSRLDAPVPPVPAQPAPMEDNAVFKLKAILDQLKIEKPPA